MHFRDLKLIPYGRQRRYGVGLITSDSAVTVTREPDVHYNIVQVHALDKLDFGRELSSLLTPANRSVAGSELSWLLTLANRSIASSVMRPRHRLVAPYNGGSLINRRVVREDPPYALYDDLLHDDLAGPSTAGLYYAAKTAMGGTVRRGLRIYVRDGILLARNWPIAVRHTRRHVKNRMVVPVRPIGFLREPEVKPDWLAWNDRTIPRMAQEVRTRLQDRWPQALCGDNNLAVIGDALEDAGCTDRTLLGLCREARWGGKLPWSLVPWLTSLLIEGNLPCGPDPTLKAT